MHFCLEKINSVNVFENTNINIEYGANGVQVAQRLSKGMMFAES